MKATFAVDQTYASFYLFKSPTTIIYTRSFQKLDEVLSYIGGLFGTIIMAFFFSYNLQYLQILN